MNKPLETSTELIVKEQINPLELFTGGNVDPILEEITRKAKAFVPDLSTGVSRKEIASMAYKVSQSKTLLDTMGKDLVSDWKAKAKSVDSSRKHIRDYLDNLRDEIRKPLTDWEEAEEKKIEEARILAQYLADWDSAITDNDLINREREIARKEAEFAKQEEERKAKEEADRLEKEKAEREERLKKEAAEKAIKEAEEKAESEKQDLRRREAQAKYEKEQAEREKIEAEENAKAAAEKAEQDRIAAEEKAAKEKQEAIEAERVRAQQEAKRKEAERLEAERVEKERLAEIAADKEHRGQINREALKSLMKIVDEEVGKKIITAIAKGEISHITINY